MVMREKIERLFAQYGYDELITHILALFPQWISVDDRLPEEDGEYLTYSGYFSTCTSYNKGRWYGNRRITHWQSLPTPPKEDK